MSDRQARMLAYLSREQVWVTAGELADHLGVTPRSVRSYVTNVKAAAHPLEVIESGPAGYRLDPDAYAAYAVAAPGRSSELATPHARLYTIVRRLIDAPGGLDIYDVAASLFVSESTIEGDLAKVRGLLQDTGLWVDRHGGIVALQGTEADRRRLLSRMFRDESARGFVQLEAIQQEFAADTLGDFKTDLISLLGSQGYFVNEFGLNNVLLHLAIALDRVAGQAADARYVREEPARPDAGRGSRGTGPGTRPGSGLADGLASLVITHFSVELSAIDLDYVTLLLTSRAITPGNNVPVASLIDGYVLPADLEIVRRIVQQTSEAYLVDLADEDFIVRLTMHVRNLINRAQENAYSANPLTRSIKTAYPMTYELAVFIASELQLQEQVVITDDEIAYIAMHVGAHLEQQSRKTELVSCAIVSPNYYDMHLVLLQRLEHALGTELDVVTIITRTDVDWASLDVDLVLTTISPPAASEHTLLLQPFLTDADIDRIRQSISRVRRVRRRAQLKVDMLQFFDPDLFMRNFHAADEIAMINALGERMMVTGTIDRAYVDGAIARERLSSTAFTDSLAVPHSMTMSAARTSIAIVINEVPMDWGDNRVNVVAFIAFSQSGRQTFQSFFDQFVDVFADRAAVQGIVKRAHDFASFIDELVRVMDQ